MVYYYYFLRFCWIQFASILLKIFPSVFIRDIGLWFSFLVVSLSGFDILVILAFYKEFESVSSFSIC